MKYSIREFVYYVCVRLPNIVLGRYIRRNLVFAHWGRGLHNFGDCLTPIILKFYGLTPVFVPTQRKANVVLAGSILQWIPEDFDGYIIGTGGDNNTYNFPNATICAVRGELTKKNLPNHQTRLVKLGDPGLLMSLVYAKRVEKKYELGVVPHFVDRNEEFINKWKKQFEGRVHFINVLREPKTVIEEIKQCRCIVSSSLHGLIIADAFHIPNVRIVNRRTMPTPFYDYKFDDYYTSLGCQGDCLEVNGDESIDDLIRHTSVKPIERIERLQKDLDAIMKQVSRQFVHNRKSCQK